MEELNSGPPKTNPSSGREEDLNPGPPDYKSNALPLGHARLRETLSGLMTVGGVGTSDFNPNSKRSQTAEENKITMFKSRSLIGQANTRRDTLKGDNIT